MESFLEKSYLPDASEDIEQNLSFSEMIQNNLLTKQRLTDLKNELTVARGEGIVREFGTDRYTLLYLKWITNKDLLL